MKQLALLQRNFQDYLLGRSESILASVEGSVGLAADDRLAVYRFAYGQRLIEALGNDFPGLLALLGEAPFAALGRRYLAQYPSRHPSLRWLGRYLARYLDSGAETGLHPLAADMAHFDWAVAQAFDARDQAPIGMADVFALPPQAWESFRFVFADSLSIFAGDAAIGDARRALLRDAAHDAVSSDRRTTWLVWRQGEEIQFRDATPEEAACLALMGKGGTFGDMCDWLMTNAPAETPARAAEFIKDWVERGLVVGLEHDAALSC
ncbi:putative DNA-binding domain-containing protein [Dongia sp.]|uniref:HvfC/BufC family peptide modification chaperone n=1 Tax=Dongia sp. TaxID=1977262 RepID=UPI0035B2FE69